MSEYHKLPLSETDQEIQSEHGSRGRGENRRNIVPWIWCTVCTIISVLAVTSTIVQRHQLSALSNGGGSRLPTDFVSAPEIPYKKEYFYNYYDYNPSIGALQFNDTGVPKLYAGEPTKEMDDAWNELLEGTYMELSSEERSSVQKAAPWNLQALEEDKVYMEVSVFHNLHCLDLVRRALSPDRYDIHTDFTKHLDPKWGMVHVYHCIDQLRQAIQCHSDLTPVPLFSVKESDTKMFFTHSVSHTCRDFNAVVDWRKERNKEKAPFNWMPWTG